MLELSKEASLYAFSTLLDTSVVPFSFCQELLILGRKKNVEEMALEPDILFYTLESCHLRDVGKQVLELRGGLVSPFVRQKSLASPESGTCNTLIVFICSAFSLAFPLHLAL